MVCCISLVLSFFGRSDFGRCDRSSGARVLEGVEEGSSRRRSHYRRATQYSQTQGCSRLHQQGFEGIGYCVSRSFVLSSSSAFLTSRIPCSIQFDLAMVVNSGWKFMKTPWHLRRVKQITKEMQLLADPSNKAWAINHLGKSLV